MSRDFSHADCSEPIHVAFGLTYANYLVLPRSLLQSMPVEWQSRFVRCVEELHAYFDEDCMAPQYTVSARDQYGKFIADPAPHYNRGRTVVPPRKPPAISPSITSEEP